VPLSVPVTNGEFAVTIPAVPEACVKGKDVHLQVAVRQGLDSFVVLGKQRVTPVVGAGAAGMKTFTTCLPMASLKTVGCSWVTKAMVHMPGRGNSTITTRRKVSLLRPLRASTIWRIVP
jgi:hypothetical protein